MEIFLIRHTSIHNPDKLCYGHSDITLASSFETEARALISKLPPIFEQVISSPSLRCLALASRLANKQDLRIDERLKEMHFGDWEQQPWHAIPAQELQPWMDNFVEIRTPNGENLHDLYNRVAVFFDELLEQSVVEPIAIVSHGGVLRCVWAYLLEIPLRNIFRIDIAYGEVLHFQHNHDPAKRRIFSLKSPLSQ